MESIYVDASYFSYKYDIMPFIWLKPLHHVLNCVKLYITNHVITLRFGYFARDQCIIRNDSDHDILTSTAVSVD